MMASISVYGYENQMLAALEEPCLENEGKGDKRLSYHKLPHGSTSCPLLRVPIEVRNNIYQFVVPTTTQIIGKGAAWLRGSISLLAVNKQIHNEAIKMMYGTSTFVIDVNFDSITFVYQWVLPSGLVPETSLAFPDKFVQHNLALIRKYQIRIHVVDSYTGMTKYNIGGRSPLIGGVQGQVAKLARIL